MSNSALRAAMWSLLCAAGLIAAVGIGDPSRIQTALVDSGGGLKRDVLVAETTNTLDRVVARHEGMQPTAIASSADSTEASPPLRIATTDVRSLQLERDLFPDDMAKPRSDAKRQSAEVLLPPPVSDALGEAREGERRVPEPLADPFDPWAHELAELPGMNEERVAEIASAAIDERLREIQSQVRNDRVASEIQVNSDGPQGDQCFVLPRTCNSDTCRSDATSRTNSSDEIESSFGPAAVDLGDGYYQLQVAGRSIAEVLQILGELEQKNILATELVEGTVRCDLQRVTVDEALQALAQAHGLTIDRTGSFTIVRDASEPMPTHKPERSAPLPAAVSSSPRVTIGR